MLANANLAIMTVFHVITDPCELNLYLFYTCVGWSVSQMNTDCVWLHSTVESIGV